MSFMPPEELGGPETLPDEMPPEAMNGMPPQNEFEDVEAIVDDLAAAMTAGAKKAATTDVAEEFQRYGQGIYAIAQAISELLPPKPDPAAKAKAEADMVKEGAKLAQQQEEAEAQRAHEKEIEKLRARTQRLKVERDGDGNMTGITKET